MTSDQRREEGSNRVSADAIALCYVLYYVLSLGGKFLHEIPQKKVPAAHYTSDFLYNSLSHE